VATSRSSSSLLAGTNRKSAFRRSFLFPGDQAALDTPGPPRSWQAKPSMSFFTESSAVFLAPLASWFDEARRDLPWRDKDLQRPHPDPYAVLVSELMLQQTQVATVLPFFGRWMTRFPDPQSLALAHEDEVHKLWEGLGYYRRARHLQAAAQAILERGWPKDFAGLLQLPGLGPYTAAALASIAFQWPEPALDGNAFRVLARLHTELDPKARAVAFRDWLRQALKILGPSRLTQALMELGAVVCLPKSPHCSDCPLAERCGGFASGDPARFPARAQRPVPRTVVLWLVAVEAEGCFLLERPQSTGLLSGLWRWPTLEENLPASKAAEATGDYSCLEWTAFPGWTQVYTHRREVIRPLGIRLLRRSPVSSGRAWVPAKNIDNLPMGSRDQRLRTLLGNSGTQAQTAPPLAWLLKEIVS